MTVVQPPALEPWKVLAQTRFTNTITGASTNEIVAGATAIKPGTGKTWVVKEVRIYNASVTAGKFSNFQIYSFKSGGTDFVAGDFGTSGFTIADGAKANNSILVANNSTAPPTLVASTAGQVFVMAAGDEMKCALRSGATVPAAGDIVLMCHVSGDEF